ncbi:N-acetyl-alpha-D-glucosaminyl L-malate synthase [subsurface metagenome]
MKILQVFDLFSLPHGGGTVSLLNKLLQALVQRGHEVTLYTSDFELDRDYINSLPEVKIYPFHCMSSAGGFYFTPDMIGEVRNRLRDFDVVHIHTFRSFQNIVIHHYARKHGIPYIIDSHGSLPRVHGGKISYKWLLKWLFDISFGYRILKDAGRVIAETEVGVNEYKKLNVSQDKIVEIAPPLDIGEFSQLPPRGLFRRNYNIDEKHIIMFLGRIHWIKGLDFLVESFYELAKSRSDVILVLVGTDDGYKATLDRLIDRLNLADKVLFTGFLGGEEKLSALVDASVVIQTSVYEQGVRVPFEAILCNAPVIVTRHTGPGEIIGKTDTGYLVEYGNNNELRDMIQYIISNPAEVQSKTRKAKEYIKANLSLEKGAEKYEELYRYVTRRNVS